MDTVLNAVTGATGYTGKDITKRLLEKGERVINITGHPGRMNPFGGKGRILPVQLR
jgi:NADH dehydrogenase